MDLAPVWLSAMAVKALGVAMLRLVDPVIASGRRVIVSLSLLAVRIRAWPNFVRLGVGAIL